MALTKKDKEDIGKIVKVKVSGLEIKVTKEFGLLKLERLTLPPQKPLPFLTLPILTLPRFMIE